MRVFARVHAICCSEVSFWRFFRWVHKKFGVLRQHLLELKDDEDREKRSRVENGTECKELCLKHCDCKSYSYNRGSEMPCWIWKQELVDLQESMKVVITSPSV